MRYSDICGKQVINIVDGSLVGHVCDLGFDPHTYEVYALYVQPCRSIVKKLLPWLFSVDEIEITIPEIENISGDVILVHFRIQ